MTTNNKIKIVYENIASLNSDWLIGLVNKHFDLVPYDPLTTYDKQNTVFYQNIVRHRSSGFDQFVECGYKIIIDNLWETLLPADPDHLVLHNVNWFWYNESLWYSHIGYDSYVPAPTYQKTALMPMRLRNPYRTMLKQQLENYLDDFVWSYVAEGQQLPNGGDAVNDWNTQRLFRPEWYDTTCFSIVAESFTAESSQPIFITEKTFKPMAFRHPFMIVSNPGTLAYLKSQGFETFENIFDESYDHEPNYAHRIKIIENNVKAFKKQPHSALTLEKLEHNRNHFFNKQFVEQRILNEIIEPILEYVQTP